MVFVGTIALLLALVFAVGAFVVAQDEYRLRRECGGARPTYWMTTDYAALCYRALKGDKYCADNLPEGVLEDLIPPTTDDESGPAPFAAWLERNRAKIALLPDLACRN